MVSFNQRSSPHWFGFVLLSPFDLRQQSLPQSIQICTINIALSGANIDTEATIEDCVNRFAPSNNNSEKPGGGSNAVLLECGEIQLAAFVCYIPSASLRHDLDASRFILRSYDSKCLRSKPRGFCCGCLIRRIWTNWLGHFA